jgi:hypothetical protein
MSMGVREGSEIREWQTWIVEEGDFPEKDGLKSFDMRKKHRLEPDCNPWKVGIFFSPSFIKCTTHTKECL